jgi:hypothetical protein
LPPGCNPATYMHVDRGQQTPLNSPLAKASYPARGMSNVASRGLHTMVALPFSTFGENVSIRATK